MLEKVKNLTEFCFICGIEREKLDKSAKYGYFSHIKVKIIYINNNRKIIICGTTCTTRPILNSNLN